MKTDKTTIFDLFEKHRRYVVPLFQRGYVWNRENQWEPLWDDLVAQAAEIAHNRVDANARMQKHFLGALVLNLTRGALAQVPIVEIIDGQQRLTTLQLLLKALKDESTEVASAIVMQTLTRLTVNEGSLNQPEERFKVWPTSGMQLPIQTIMEAPSAAAVEEHYKEFHKFRYKRWEPPRPGVVEAYLYFAKVIREFLDDDLEELPLDLIPLTATERAEVLIEALIRNIQLVTIELDAEDDAQVIFETLNARGEPLTASDLVRNFIFLTATRQRQDVAKLYSERWRQFEEEPPERPFWRQEERQGRLKRPRMDLFLFHYVTMQTGEELKIGHLYQSFRDWWERTDRNISSELLEFERFSVPYRELLAPDPSTRFGRFGYRFRILDTTTVYPLVLWLLGKMNMDSPDFSGVLDDIESYVVRRTVCGLNQKAYNRLFLGFLKQFRDAGSAPTRAEVRAALSASTAESAIWPDDDQFRAHLTGDATYRSVGPRRTLMLLEAIEHASVGRFAEHLKIERPLTVEHVLPQGATKSDWPLDGADDPIQARLIRDLLTQNLGNLTLLTQPLNSSVSNGPYKDKRPEIAGQSQLALNTYFQTAMVWGESEISLRARGLAERAIAIWPPPNRQAT